ncbi:MAG: hypothetical protein DRJ46_00160 [Thermoprotei archaeon]|nr:MAG: hypothetical protein DRJ46_00160 [Thermoprotei archaeon]
MEPELKKRILELFVKAREELLAPPIFLRKVVIGEELRVRIANRGLTLYIPEELIEEKERDEIILWYFRHALAHVHYCPYDVATMYQLVKAAHRELNDWTLAYFSFYIFAETQVDYHFLRNTYLQTPKHIYYRFKRRPSGPDRILYALYKQLFKKIKHHSTDVLIEDLGKELATVVKAPLSWMRKVKIIANILRKTAEKKLKETSDKSLDRYISSRFIPLREDFSRRGMTDVLTYLGQIRDEKEAKSFYKYIVKQRTEPRDTIEKISRHIKKSGKELEKEIKKLAPSPALQSPGQGLEEPKLPSSLSKPYKKPPKDAIADAVWRRYWYKARAEKAIVEFIQHSQRVKPTWAVAQYPDDWSVEDELEELDLEATFQEGPLIPEVNAVKWIRTPSHLGQVIASGYAPSTIIVLDSSRSMMQVFNDAATAAHIVYLSAKRKAGKVSAITFSTNYLSAGWEDEDEIKETILSTKLGQLTILPIHEIKRLANLSDESTFIVIITDGGWQNIDDAAKKLSDLASQGHRVVIFHLLRGWKYPKSLALLRKLEEIKVIPVAEPEEDLKGLVLEEAEKTYGTIY